MLARRISFVNFKGGVGKTSLTVNVAACLAHDLGQRVLLVDCDAQSNASIWLMGVSRWITEVKERPGNSVYGIFMPTAPNVFHAVQRSVLRDERGVKLIPNLDLLPAVYDLMELEHEYKDNDVSPFYRKFYDEISIFFDQYDYIIFDCPPNVFRASKCAIFASEEIYVPCNPDLLSYVGLSMLAEKVKQFLNQTVIQRQQIPNYRPAVIRGIILNSVDNRANLEDITTRIQLRIHVLRSHQVVSDDADILATRIRRSVKASHVVDENLPITLTKLNADLKDDYLNLCRYIHHTPLRRKAQANELERQTK